MIHQGNTSAYSKVSLNYWSFVVIGWCPEHSGMLVSSWGQISSVLEKHYAITVYAWYDEMWNRRTGQCRYRAMCISLFVCGCWHLIVMNFKAGSRGSDSLGQFIETAVGGIGALYVCAGPHWITDQDQKSLGLKGSVFSLCSQCGVCFYVCVMIKAVVMKPRPLSARPVNLLLLPSYCGCSVRKYYHKI